MGDEPPPTLTIRQTRIPDVSDRRVTSHGAHGRGVEPWPRAFSRGLDGVDRQDRLRFYAAQLRIRMLVSKLGILSLFPDWERDI